MPDASRANRRAHQYAMDRLIGSRLRVEREAADHRQEDVASALGRPQSYVSEVERGHRSAGLHELRRWASFLGLTVEELIAEPEPGTDEEDRYKEDLRAFGSGGHP